jgi:hypothetical protein
MSANMTETNPDPQTLLTVIAPTVVGKPARWLACLAGAWPDPAWMTWPMIT